MKLIRFSTALALYLGVICFAGERATCQPALHLPNGFTLTPAGKAIPLAGDMPVKMLLSRDGSKLLVETTGFHDHGVYVIDTRTQKLAQSVGLQKLWPGLALSSDGKTVYMSGGQVYDSKTYESELSKHPDIPAEFAHSFQRSIVALPWDGNALGKPQNVAVSVLDDISHFDSGIATAPNGTLYTLDQNHDELLRLSSKINLTDSRGADGAPAAGGLSVDKRVSVGYRPYAVLISPDQKTLAVSNWGDKSVSLIDSATMQVRQTVQVGSHPNEMVFSKDGRLFVACAGSNSVSVIAGGKVVETIDTALRPGAPVGSTPDAVALTPDGKRLYVANADNNDVAEVDVAPGKAGSHLLGFIPTGWYPSALAVSKTGQTLYIGTAKGTGPFGANYPPKSTPDRQSSGPDGTVKSTYIGFLLNGAVYAVPTPTEAQLASYTKQVLLDTPYTRMPPKLASDGLSVLRGGKIKHVLFIVRENRTYDQVFGDMGKGNSDPNICIFGKKITPNAHALASRYVLFDNLYCDGEVSEDGHQWCDAAYATDFTEKAWVNSYSGRSEPEADERLTASPAGYLWDNCARHGLSYFSYGEMATFTSSPNSPPKFTGEKDLAGHNSPEVETVKWGKQHDTARAAFFIKDLHRAERTGKWPQFVVMWLGEDHTQGLQAGAFAPSSMVAGNDLGVAQVVEAVTHSRFWKDTAIFIIEDDAQDGPDHVDAHRTVGLLISPYAKRGVVDSTRYDTSSFVRTMEMALHLPMMTQFDAGAMPLTNALTMRPDFTVYQALPENVDLDARNPSKTSGAKKSAMLDLTGPDKADPDALNAILWEAMRPGTPVPAPVRSFAVR